MSFPDSTIFPFGNTYVHSTIFTGCQLFARHWGFSSADEEVPMLQELSFQHREIDDDPIKLMCSVVVEKPDRSQERDDGPRGLLLWKGCKRKHLI